MKSGNPVLNEKVFEDVAGAESDRMTLGGTVNKTAMLLALVLITAAWTWGTYFETRNPATVMPWLWLVASVVLSLPL
jgi:uncharacterized YccA/Bax inhibitor family protein